MCCLVKLVFFLKCLAFWNLPWGSLCFVFSELELPNQCHAGCGWCFLLRIVEVGCGHAGGDVVGFLTSSCFENLAKGETGSLSVQVSTFHPASYSTIFLGSLLTICFFSSWKDNWTLVLIISVKLYQVCFFDRIIFLIDCTF